LPARPHRPLRFSAHASLIERVAAAIGVWAEDVVRGAGWPVRVAAEGAVADRQRGGCAGVVDAAAVGVADVAGYVAVADGRHAAGYVDDTAESRTTVVASGEDRLEGGVTGRYS